MIEGILAGIEEIDYRLRQVDVVIDQEYVLHTAISP
jgi:hypothetical protein